MCLKLKTTQVWTLWDERKGLFTTILHENVAPDLSFLNKNTSAGEHRCSEDGINIHTPGSAPLHCHWWTNTLLSDQWACGRSYSIAIAHATQKYLIYLENACNNRMLWIMYSVLYTINKQWVLFDQSRVSLNQPWLFPKVAHLSKVLTEQERSRLMFCFFACYFFNTHQKGNTKQITGYILYDRKTPVLTGNG